MGFPLNSTPGTSVRGRLTEVWAVTKTHGAVQLPIIQEYSMDPIFNTGTIGEFATNKDVLTTQSYKNESITFKLFETDLVALYNALMDLAPGLSSQTPIAVLREQMYGVSINLYGNTYHQFNTGTKFQGFLATQCRVVNITPAIPIDGDATVSVKMMANWGTTVKAGAILYSRVVSSAPVYSSVNPPQPSDISFSGHIAYLTRTTVSLPLPGTGGLSQIDLATFKNGIQVYPTSGATTNYTINYGNQFTVPGTIATTDVYENYAVYASTTANP